MPSLISKMSEKLGGKDKWTSSPVQYTIQKTIKGTIMLNTKLKKVRSLAVKSQSKQTENSSYILTAPLRKPIFTTAHRITQNQKMTDKSN